MKWRGWATGHPLDLAVFRITISAVVLMSADVWDAPKWAGAAVRAPVGWEFVSTLLPAAHDTALVALGLVVIFTSLTLLGVFTRVSSVIAALSLVWLLGVPQQSGVVLHTHHLAWFMALVASGPSGDALSVDAWRRKTSVAPSLAHGLPVRAAWVSIGLIFSSTKNESTAVNKPPTNSTSPVPTRFLTPSTSVIIRDTSCPLLFASK